MWYYVKYNCGIKLLISRIISNNEGIKLNNSEMNSNSAKHYQKCHSTTVLHLSQLSQYKEYT